MSTYRRPRVPGACVFFTVALARPGSGLLVERIDALREAVRKTRAERPFEIDAWVVLPDHLHAVWTLPPEDFDYPTRWSVIKARFSRVVPAGHRRASHELRRERGVWQRRYWEHHIRSDAERARAIRFCHTDPVRHGLSSTPQDWTFSTIHRDLRAADRAA